MDKKQLIAGVGIFIFLLVANVCVAKQPSIDRPNELSLSHFIDGNNVWSYEEVDSVVINKRLEESAIEMGKKGAVSRFALYDIALPADTEEYIALNKNAVLMITAVTHNKEELPIKNAYVRTLDSVVILERILSKVTDIVVDNQISLVFGKYREDCFYLLPYYLLGENEELVVDWKNNRDSFMLGSLLREWECGIEDDEHPEIQNLKLNKEVLKNFLKREYMVVFKNK